MMKQDLRYSKKLAELLDQLDEDGLDSVDGIADATLTGTETDDVSWSEAFDAGLMLGAAAQGRLVIWADAGPFIFYFIGGEAEVIARVKRLVKGGYAGGKRKGPARRTRRTRKSKAPRKSRRSLGQLSASVQRLLGR